MAKKNKPVTWWSTSAGGKTSSGRAKSGDSCWSFAVPVVVPVVACILWCLYALIFA